GLQYKYLLGKRRGCPFYTTGDDNASALCTACLKGNPPRMIVDESAIMRDRGKGLYFLEKKYVKSISESRRSVVQNGVCLYQSMKQIPGMLDLITYPYITNRNISEAKVLDSLPLSFLIVDEAHNLENSSEIFTDKISPKMIENESSEMLGFRYKFGSEEAFQKFKQRLGRFALGVSKFCNGDGTTQHKEKEEFGKVLHEDLKDDVFDINDAYLKIEEERRELARSGSTKKVPNPIFPIVDFISNFEELYEKIELFAENRGVSIKVLDPAENLKILGEAGGLLLMSGTMPSRERIERVWGLENVEELRLLRDYAPDYYSVFPRENREMRLIDTVTSKFDMRGDLTWSSYASIVEQVDANNEKITLVCCPSYSVAQNIYRQLSEESKERSYLETSSTRLEDVMESVSDAALGGSKKIVIGVARGKILEGVEFVRDGSSLIGAVVVAGIPYPIPDDIQRWRSRTVLN
ncbi:MAG: helicase C-terminal domain-containing protein, partial [Nitrososphaerales archaeon]